MSDTGPLIVLYETSLLWLLRELHGTLAIPEAVKTELLRKPEGRNIVEEKWIETLTVAESDTVDILAALLDEGEAEAIALAKEKDLPILLDEKKGRAVAKSLTLEVEGTLGIIVAAKRKSLIDSAKDCILKLLAKGYYIDEELLKSTLTFAGEKQ